MYQDPGLKFNFNIETHPKHIKRLRYRYRTNILHIPVIFCQMLDQPIRIQIRTVNDNYEFASLINVHLYV
jgi:hypothetical protein